MKSMEYTAPPFFALLPTNLAVEVPVNIRMQFSTNLAAPSLPCTLLLEKLAIELSVNNNNTYYDKTHKAPPCFAVL